MALINYNGTIYSSSTPIINAANPSLRYGDGLFETIRVKEGQLLLGELHFARLFKGMQLLHFEIPETFTQDYLRSSIISLCEQNKIEHSARVRLNVFRSESSTEHPDTPSFIIEAWEIPRLSSEIDPAGICVDVYEDGKKGIDVFSNCKTNNYLLYVMASRHASEHYLDEALVMNHEGRVCDGSTSNIFWVKSDLIYTPPLSEGCIAGVMRTNLLTVLPAKGFNITEKQTDIEELLNADEIFMTNAIRSIRWVRQFRNKKYTSKTAASIYSSLL